MKSQATLSRRDIINMRDTSMSKFNADLTSIVNAVYSKNKKDDEIISIKDKLSIARKENPVGLIEIAGPHIWKYREQIERENISFFIRNNFENDIIEASKEIAEITEFEKTSVLLDKAKSVWHMLLKEEQIHMIKLIKSLLQHYSTYLSASKKLKEIEN
jgi:hypothetical protein